MSYALRCRQCFFSQASPKDVSAVVIAFLAPTDTTTSGCVSRAPPVRF